uniref:RRP15-like protein n=1 Tax=Panagrolaimus sp. PS1159 TaxID=55785 RepID=A0AC35EZA6_9BILA
MTLMASKRPASGDKLVVKTEENFKRKKLQETAASSSSNSEEDDSLSETTDSEEDESDHNPTALKPIKEFGVDINAKFQTEEEKAKPTKLTRKQKKKLTRVDRAKKMKQHAAHLKLGMVKPDLVADREKERKLAHIATKGVTQLFNTVAERQLQLEAEAKKANAKKPVKKASLKANAKKPVKKASLVPEPTRPPLSQHLKIRVPMAAPPLQVKKEEESGKFDPNETVTLNDTDTDLPTEAEIKTEPESDSD